MPTNGGPASPGKVTLTAGLPIQPKTAVKRWQSVKVGGKQVGGPTPADAVRQRLLEALGQSAVQILDVGGQPTVLVNE